MAGLIELAILLTSAGLFQVVYAADHVAVACENEKLEIKCSEKNAKIGITSALYGRQTKYRCWRSYGGVWSTKCKAPKSEEAVKKACEGKLHCQIEAKNSVFGGDPCALTEKYLEVNYVCKVDGGFSKWSEYSKCTKSCGGGSKTRTRTCTSPAPKDGGKDCQGIRSQSKPCNSNGCPVNGGLSKWSAYGRCSKTCGGGTQTRIRTCTNPRPASGGSDCSKLGRKTQTKACNTKACYVRISSEIERHVCEWGDMYIDCGGTAKIMITSALYGRKTKNLCWKWHGLFWDLKCSASNALLKVKTTCEGKTDCLVFAMSSVFGDPCPFTAKYLQVRYRCKG